jgi:hypothetical protein
MLRDRDDRWKLIAPLTSMGDEVFNHAFGVNSA